MFDNIHNIKSKIKSQQEEGGIIYSKKAGAPRKPNMEKVQIKLDKSLHAFLKKNAKETGINKSAIIAVALKNHYNEKRKEEKIYKLVEI